MVGLTKIKAKWACPVTFRWMSNQLNLVVIILENCLRHTWSGREFNRTQAVETAHIGSNVRMQSVCVCVRCYYLFIIYLSIYLFNKTRFMLLNLVSWNILQEFIFLLKYLWLNIINPSFQHSGALINDLSPP